MPFADLSEARIHYSLTGSGGGPALVFSHSVGADLSMWNAQTAAFADRRVLRFDTRGHGQSSSPPGPYSIERLAKDVLELLNSLKLDKVDFCGLSLGGQIGQWLGLNAPTRLHKLVLCNTGSKIGNEEGWNARIDTVLAKGMKEIAPAVIGRWFTPQFIETNPAQVGATRAALEATDPQGYVACCAAVRDFDARAEIAKLRVPTLVITGAHDPATPPADGRFIADQVSGARYAELDAAHISNIEARERFNHEVGSFLAA